MNIEEIFLVSLFGLLSIGATYFLLIFAIGKIARTISANVELGKLETRKKFNQSEIINTDDDYKRKVSVF